MVKVLFVCLGNICRSPTAEGVFRKLVHEEGLEELIEIDSAGTHAYHIGEPPDMRATVAAARRGIDLTPLRGRQATPEDLVYYDYVLAMDSENQRHLRDLSSEHGQKVRLLLDYAQSAVVRDVPDPYWGGARGFEQVLDMIEDATRGLLSDIRQRHDLS
jgi:low molecular weight protein-tyrosine phosphatase